VVTIKIIIGSTRPNRFGPKPAAWILDLAKTYKNAMFELVDLAEVDLPLLDEPVPAMGDNYTKDHTKRWADIVGPADGFVFVVPEYNHSYAPATKNAIDFLYKEWNYKPVAFVSYGAALGGGRAVEHLRAVASNVKLFDLNEQVLFPNYFTQLDEQGNLRVTEQQTKDANRLLEQIVFWAEQFKDARAKLVAK
jgi:NAD(P)H-dependent FMN reductase